MGEELFMILRVTKTARAASAGDILLPKAPTPKAFPRASRARVAIPRFGLRLLLWIPWSSSWRFDGRPSAVRKRKTKTTGTSWKWMISLSMYLKRNYLAQLNWEFGKPSEVGLTLMCWFPLPGVSCWPDARPPYTEDIRCKPSWFAMRGMGDNAMKKLGV